MILYEIDSKFLTEMQSAANRAANTTQRKGGSCSSRGLSRKEAPSSMRLSSFFLAAMLVVLLVGHASGDARVAGNSTHTANTVSTNDGNRKQGVSLRGPDDKEHYSFETLQGQDFRCFESNDELRAAVLQYKGHTHFHERLARTYGWPIGNWCTSKVQDFGSIFQHQRHFNEPLTGWSTASATNMGHFFQDAQQFDQDLSHFDTSQVQNMEFMFEAAVRFTGAGLENWTTHRLTNMAFTFMHALKFNADISKWSVEHVIDMKGVFRDARAFSHDVKVLSQWDFHPDVDTLQMCDWWSENGTSHTTSLLRGAQH